HSVHSSEGNSSVRDGNLARSRDAARRSNIAQKTAAAGRYSGSATGGAQIAYIARGASLPAENGPSRQWPTAVVQVPGSGQVATNVPAARRNLGDRSIFRPCDYQRCFF